MNHPTHRQLREARRRFEQLLSEKTEERMWQEFFSTCPYVLSRSLPLRLAPSDIIPLGRPGQSEPDFVFYPRNFNSVPAYGVIELKKPSSKILTTPRRNIITLTRDADTAVRQVQVYAKELKPTGDVVSTSSLILGSQEYLFVVMGSSGELMERLASELWKEQMDGLLPRGVQLIPYDVLLEEFGRTLLPKVYWLIPSGFQPQVTSPEEVQASLDLEEIQETTLLGDIESIASPEPGPLSNVLRAEQEKRYRLGLSKLSVEDQVLMVARLELGYSYQHLASRFGKRSPDAARIAVRRAMLRLAKEMAE